MSGIAPTDSVGFDYQSFARIWSLQAFTGEESVFDQGEVERAKPWTKLQAMYQPALDIISAESSISDALKDTLFDIPSPTPEQLTKAIEQLNDGKPITCSTSWPGHAISITFQQIDDQLYMAYNNRGDRSSTGGESSADNNWRLFKCDKPLTSETLNLIMRGASNPEQQTFIESVVPGSSSHGLQQRLESAQVATQHFSDQKGPDCFHQAFKGAIFSLMFLQVLNDPGHEAEIEEATKFAFDVYKRSIRTDLRNRVAKTFIEGIAEKPSLNSQERQTLVGLLLKMSSKVVELSTKESLSDIEVQQFKTMKQRLSQLIKFIKKSELDPTEKSLIVTQIRFNANLKHRTNSAHIAESILTQLKLLDVPVNSDEWARLENDFLFSESREGFRLEEWANKSNMTSYDTNFKMRALIHLTKDVDQFDILFAELNTKSQLAIIKSIAKNGGLVIFNEFFHDLNSDNKVRVATALGDDDELFTALNKLNKVTLVNELNDEQRVNFRKNLEPNNQREMDKILIALDRSIPRSSLLFASTSSTATPEPRPADDPTPGGG